MATRRRGVYNTPAESVEADENSRRTSDEIIFEGGYAPELQVTRPPGWWRLRNGKYINIIHLDTSHINNILARLMSRPGNNLRTELQTELMRREQIRAAEREQALTGVNEHWQQTSERMARQIAQDQIRQQVQAGQVSEQQAQRWMGQRWTNQGFFTEQQANPITPIDRPVPRPKQQRRIKT